VGSGTSTINANAATNINANQTLAALNIGADGVVTLAEIMPSPAPVDFTPVGGEGWAIDGLASVSVAAVPEPGSLSLLCLGALAIFGRRRRWP
jgi:hypothetical protein